MGIAENIARIRREHDLTQEEFGKIAGVSSMAVSQWENGRAVPRMGAVQRIADYFHISKGEVIDESTHGIPVYSSGDASVPLVTLGKVHAGSWDEEDAEGVKVDVPASVLRHHPHARATIVEGDCMDQLVLPGQAVVWDPDIEPANGDAVVVETPDYEAVLRRWYRGGDTLMLVADSTKDYPDIVIKLSDEVAIRVVGTVIFVQSPRELR